MNKTFKGTSLLYIAGASAVSQFNQLGFPQLETVLAEELGSLHVLKPTDPAFQYLGYSQAIEIKPIFTQDLERANLLEVPTDLFIRDQGYSISTALLEVNSSVVDFIFDLPASVQSISGISQHGGREVGQDYSLLIIYHNNLSQGSLFGIAGLCKVYYFNRVKALPATRVISLKTEIKDVEFIALHNFNPVAGQQLMSRMITALDNPNTVYNYDGTPVNLNPEEFFPVNSPIPIN